MKISRYEETDVLYGQINECRRVKKSRVVLPSRCLQIVRWDSGHLSITTTDPENKGLSDFVVVSERELRKLLNMLPENKSLG